MTDRLIHYTSLHKNETLLKDELSSESRNRTCAVERDDSDENKQNRDITGGQTNKD